MQISTSLSILLAGILFTSTTQMNTNQIAKHNKNKAVNGTSWGGRRLVRRAQRPFQDGELVEELLGQLELSNFNITKQFGVIGRRIAQIALEIAESARKTSIETLMEVMNANAKHEHVMLLVVSGVYDVLPEQAKTTRPIIGCWRMVRYSVRLFMDHISRMKSVLSAKQQRFYATIWQRYRTIENRITHTVMRPMYDEFDLAYRQKEVCLMMSRDERHNCPQCWTECEARARQRLRRYPNVVLETLTRSLEPLMAELYTVWQEQSDQIRSFRAAALDAIESESRGIIMCWERFVPDALDGEL